MTVARLRPLAEQDLVERTQYYRRVGGQALAERFFAAAVDALVAISDAPGVGSPRAAELTGIEGLRVRRIKGFPCGWFYVAGAVDVDVVRLLADAQDLPALLSDLDP